MKAAAGWMAFLLAAVISTQAVAQVPGVRGIDHVGLTVPDVGKAAAFFHDVLACEPVIAMQGRAVSGDFLQRQLGLPQGAAMAGSATIRCGYGANLELFDYRAPNRDERRPNNADAGGHHLGFYVDDLSAAVAYLKTKGLTVMGEPQTTTSGPSAGQSWVYFLSAWGLQLELVSYPAGKAYEKDNPPVRLWSPKTPAQ